MEEERQRRRLATGFPVKWNLPASDVPNSVGLLPSGKRLHNYGKSPFFSWENSL